MNFKWIFLGALVFLGALNADARKTNKPDKTKKPAAESTTAAKSKKALQDHYSEAGCRRPGGSIPQGRLHAARQCREKNELCGVY